DDAVIFHVKDGATEQQRIGEVDDNVVRLARFIELHAHSRQLTEPDGEVVVGAREVGVPAAAAVLAAIGVEEGTAVIEGAIEVGGRRPFRRRASKASVSAAAYPDPRAPSRILLVDLRKHCRRDGQHDCDEERGQEATVAHEGLSALMIAGTGCFAARLSTWSPQNTHKDFLTRSAVVGGI